MILYAQTPRPPMEQPPEPVRKPNGEPQEDPLVPPDERPPSSEPPYEIPPEPAGQPVTVGLRPEHLQEGDPAESHLKCTARLVAHLGADTLVNGPLGREGVDIAVRLSGFRMIESGQVLALSAAPEQIHLFDRGNGKRIQLD